MIKKLLPVCLEHNPNWVFFYNVTDFLWKDYVTKNIPQLIETDGGINLEDSREDLLLKASRIGWTFSDNFSANWHDDDRAERFLKRFISSWVGYCRNSDGTTALQTYMGYLLGMEIRIVQLWSDARSDWDSTAMPRLYDQGTSQLPDNYIVKAGEVDPFSEGKEEARMYSITELTSEFPDWRDIGEDPQQGWYPTSHFDIYIDLEQMPKSDLQEKSSEDIITGLFYELADLDMVLRSIIYSYNFTQVVKVASGSSVIDRISSIN